ncbi:MAG TPA: HAD family phosphatase [Usitatibacter sp.]|nr:HAD family phosphatase [Usitatibacter sp.]
MSAAGREDIDAILYDFGGVVIEIDFDWIFERWAQLAGVPMERVKSRFSHGEAYQRHECGEITLEEYYESLRRELGIDLTDEQFTDGWQRVFGPENPGTVAIIAQLAGRVPQYLLSNTNKAHYDFWSQRYAAALKPLRKVFTSCAMGCRKPGREAFEHVARETGVALDRILFLDDTESNLEGARAAGMKTVLVRSQEDVARALSPWLA